MADDIKTGSLYLYQLFHVLSVIMILDYICMKVHFYTISTCTDGVFMYMCLLLVVICEVCHWLSVLYY